MPMADALTLRAGFDRIRVAFRAAGLDTPDLDARVLTAHVAGLPPSALLGAEMRPLSRADAERLDALAERRIAREPIARILGRREFWGLELALAPTSLVPRPDTETVVEAALDWLRRTGGPGWAEISWRMADLGTGSGAILLALLAECPRALGIGVDRDLATLDAARANAATHGFASRALMVAGDWAAPLTPGGFDLIVSNPPYVATLELSRLDPEVRDYDPRAALDGGVDGLSAYRALVPEAARALRPGGALFLEIGEGQTQAVTDLVVDAGLLPLDEPLRDLSGTERVVRALAQ